MSAPAGWCKGMSGRELVDRLGKVRMSRSQSCNEPRLPGELHQYDSSSRSDKEKENAYEYS